MNAELAAQVLALHNEANAQMKQIGELGLPRPARIAAQAGIEQLCNRLIANLMIDNGLAQEPDIKTEYQSLPPEAIHALWSTTMTTIATEALSAAAVAVVTPLLPSDPDL